jgi:peptide/nickel transport system permease protein
MSIETQDILSRRTKRTMGQSAMRLLKSAPFSAKFGMAVIAFYVFCALFAPIIAPYSESEIVGKAYGAPSLQNWFGLDQIGRDTLSRVIFGGRNTIGIALLTVIISFSIGGSLGIYAAVTRGWMDQIVSRLVDVLMSIPVLIFALMLLAMAGKLARNTALSVAVQDFVEAARLRGEKMLWIVFREIVPNILPTLIAEFGLRFSFVFLTIAALSFLGVGIQPPTADWGSMVADSKTLISHAKIQPLIPAAAIALLTVAVNFVVDWFLQKTSGLRDEQ